MAFPGPLSLVTEAWCMDSLGYTEEVAPGFPAGTT